MVEYKIQCGSHSSPAEGMCAMEWVAYLAGEKHSDAPACVDVSVRLFVDAVNNGRSDSAVEQLRPYLGRMIGTAEDRREQQRAYMLADWAIRHPAVEALEVIAREDLADRLRALSEVTDEPSAIRAMEVFSVSFVGAILDAADATNPAAYAAARAAAGATNEADSAAWTAVNEPAETVSHALEAAYHSEDAAYESTGGGPNSRADMWDRLLPSIWELMDRMLPAEAAELSPDAQREYDQLLGAA